MFDVGFSELIVIALVALIVIGPERLPKVARTAGVLLGRLQRYVNDVKADINREIQLEELKKMQDSVTANVQELQKSLNEQMRSVEDGLNRSILAGIEEKSGTRPQETASADAPVPAPEAVAVPEPVAVAAPEAGAEPAIKPMPASAPIPEAVAAFLPPADKPLA